MAFKLTESVQTRWRAVYASHLVALMRAGAVSKNGKLIDDAEGRSSRLLGAFCSVRPVTRLALLCDSARRTCWRDVGPPQVVPPGAVSLEDWGDDLSAQGDHPAATARLVAGSQSADPAAAFNDGQPGLVRAGDSRDPHAHL
jgi:hypothetical protein